MCLVAFALGQSRAWPVLVAANRDEQTSRAADALHLWPQGFTAGRDREAGGTWMGAAPGGRWALVTNVRDPEAVAAVRAGRRFERSRGALPVAFLAGEASPEVFASVAHAERGRYAPFNLLVGVGSDVWFVSARETAPRRLGPGVYGLSNATLDTPWPKLVRTRHRLAALVVGGDPPNEALFAILDDTEGAPDDALPETGVGRALERVLAAPRIVTDGYGTRATTVLRLAPDGSGHLAEQTWHADGRPGGLAQVVL